MFKIPKVQISFQRYVRDQHFHKKQENWFCVVNAPFNVGHSFLMSVKLHVGNINPRKENCNQLTTSLIKMKNVVSIALFSIFFSISSYGQTLIPKVGVSFSTLHADEFVTQMDNQFGNKTGYSFGIGYNIPVKLSGNGLLSIQPEISYVQKGFKVDAEGEFFYEGAYTLNTHQEYSIHYLEFPILAKYELGPDNFRFSVSVGPSVGFGLGGRYTSVATRTDEVETTELFNTKGDIRFFQSKDPNEANFDHNIDFGLQLGVGVSVFNKIAVDVRYGNSFTNINEYSDSKNRVLQVTVGVPIIIK